MGDLIEALTIFKKHITDPYYSEHPTSCEHDILYVSRVGKMPAADAKRLRQLGFDYNHYDGWHSFRFGCC